MNQTVRAVLAVVAGFVTAVLMIMMVERVGHGVYPMPAGLDVTDMDAMKAYAQGLSAGAQLFVLAAWMMGTYLGGVIAASIARGRPALYASIIGACVLAGAVFNLVVLPHAAWMLPASVAGIVLAAWLAARTTAAGFERAAARRA